MTLHVDAMLGEVIFFWSLFGLVLLLLVLSCFVLCYLPLCLDKVDYQERMEITKKHDAPSAVVDTDTDQTILTRAGTLVIKGLKKRLVTSATSKLGANSNIEAPLTNSHQITKMDINTDFITKTKNTLLIAHGFKAIADLLILALTIAYPPSLWILWAFFPINSTTVLGIGLIGLRSLVNFLIMGSIVHISEKWTFRIKYEPVGFTLTEYKTEIRYLVVGSTLWMFTIWVYLFLRIVFIYAGSSVFLLDGWILFTVLAFIDLLFVIFPLTTL
jgi:hypothetical protein